MDLFSRRISCLTVARPGERAAKARASTDPVRVTVSGPENDSSSSPSSGASAAWR